MLGRKKPKTEESEKIQQDPGYARSLIEASVDPLVTISAEGKITDVNKATEDATGLTRKELIGTDFSNYFTEPEKAREGYQKVLKEEVVRDYPLTIKSRAGKLIDVLYNASVYKDRDGSVLGVFAAARDITEQKQASQYARSLIEASLDPLVTISPEGKITDVNDATIKVTGADRKKLIGTKFSDYFTEPEKAEQGYQEVLEKGEVRDYALTIRHSQGKLTDVLYNASVYKDEKGKVIGVFAAARDITEQKQASQYARSLIEASLDPLVTISPEGKVTDVNEATIKITGADRKEIIGTKFSEYFTEPEKAEQGYQEVLKEGEVRDYALTIRHSQGRLINVLYNASVYKDEKGKVIGVFAAARDVTKTKQATEYARSLIEASLDPLVTISPEGKITDVNQATVRITGVTKQELIGSDFSDYFTEPEKARMGYQQVFKEGEVRDYLLTIRHRSGKLTNVLYNASVYKDSQGKVLGVFAAAREIGKSELKSARARELMKASKEAVFKVAVGLRIGQNSVKISERNCEKAGLDMVDDIIVKPTRKEITNRKLTAMSMSDSKIPPDTILMSGADIKILGLEEDDTVYIYKSEAEEGLTEIETEEREIPGLPTEETIGKEEKPETEEKIFEKEPEETSTETKIPETPAEEPNTTEEESPEKEPEETSTETKIPETPAEEPNTTEEESPEKEPEETSTETKIPETPAEEPNTTEEESNVPEEKEQFDNKKTAKPKKIKEKKNLIKREKPIIKNKKVKDFESQIDAIRNT